MEYFNLTKEEETRLVLDAFDDLQKAYSESNHKQKYELVARAFDFANKAHEGLKRLSGEPYIMHPLAVAKICVTEMGLGSTSICSALLHDVVEDTDYTVEDIKSRFGENIANIVDGLTKISGGIFANSTSQQAENFQRLILTIPSDIRVIMVKMADRLHNMRTLSSMPLVKQQKITGETLYIYAPLAERLGFFNIKTELENLCLRFQQPVVYEELENKIAELTPKLVSQYEIFIAPIKERLDARKIKYKILKRIKSPYSVYKKQITKGLKFDEIYDLLAVRIVVDTQKGTDEADACWSVFGIVTSLYQENQNRTRNWLTKHKANGYQALHLTVMHRGEKGEKGHWIEVQIRTKQMDDIAERGLAAHWKYKNGIEEQSEFDDWFQSVKELLSIQNVDTVEFVDRFKMNLNTKEIFVFTPRGEIKRLLAHSTVLDFAFALHTDLGMHCIGGKVDHKLASITEELKSGNQVEILTSKTQQPEAFWLDFVKTQKAMDKIRQSLRPEISDLLRQGQTILYQHLSKLNIKTLDENINFVIDFFGYQKHNKFLMDLARGKVDINKVTAKTFQKKSQGIFSRIKNVFKSNEEDGNTLSVNKSKVLYLTKKDIMSNAVKRATCCNPIQGDEVIGYLEDKRHIIIHKSECPEAQQLRANFGNKIILVGWQKANTLSYSTTLSIEGIDRQGLLRNIVKVISEDVQINIKSINLLAEDGIFKGMMTIFVHSNDEVERISEKLLKINSIKEVKRVNIVEN
ncbi:MAG: RelA/SpoT family protein [Prevotellaceae bacterium]|jgi:GTP pyrophosphokinase|nr:RelA/SpoT family protein [Prevotellaceae bacterium]